MPTDLRQPVRRVTGPGFWPKWLRRGMRRAWCYWRAANNLHTHMSQASVCAAHINSPFEEGVVSDRSWVEAVEMRSVRDYRAQQAWLLARSRESARQTWHVLAIQQPKVFEQEAFVGRCDWCSSEEWSGPPFACLSDASPPCDLLLQGSSTSINTVRQLQGICTTRCLSRLSEETKMRAALYWLC